MNLLDIKGLSKEFTIGKKSFLAVNEVDLSVGASECVGLIGESGSGKSTVARMIAGLTRPDKGEIFYKGHLLNRKRINKDTSYKEIQMVFQDAKASFSSRMTLLNGIMEGLNYFTNFDKKEKTKRVIEALKMVGLPEQYTTKYSWEVSGGECQRAAIARAILIRPSLLICDEITSALDVTVQAQIINLIMDLRDQLSMACLFISHDLTLVRSICSYVYVMKNGRIFEHGPTEEVFENPRIEYTKILLKSVLTVD